MNKISFTVDRNLRIRSWNDELQTLTGADAEQALGKKYTEIFPRFVANDKEAVAEVLKNRRSVHLKDCNFRCLSHHQEADIRIAPIKGKGRNDSISGARIDLRPAQPCSIGQQLIDAQKLMAIGKIAATLAHGVRNPLNAIKGAVVYLRDQYAHEKTLFEFTEILETEIHRLESFISRFLNTATFDSDVEMVDVNELIRKIKVLISLQATTRGISCEYDLQEVPAIEISPFHLEQAIMNVINNSIEAMPTGGTLAIRTSLRSNSPAAWLALEISDTGAGIDASSFRSAPGRPAKEPGRGFGLFIAEEITRFYKGQMNISGEKGKGSTITFLLPVKDVKNGESR